MSAIKRFLEDEITRIARENHYSWELIYQCYMELTEDGENHWDALKQIERSAKEQDYDECYLEFCNPCYY